MRARVGVLALCLVACAPEAPPAPAEPGYQTAQALAEAVLVAARDEGGVSVQLDLAGNGSGRCGVRTSDFAASCAVALAGSGEVSYVLSGDGIFVRIPALKADKAWVRVDPEDQRSALSRAMAQVAVRVRDSADVRKALPEAARIVERVEEGVGGVPAVRYTVHGEAGGKPVVARMWVDGRDRVLRSEARTSVTGGEPVEVVATYLDWGKPVDVAPPPAEQVAALPR